MCASRALIALGERDQVDSAAAGGRAFEARQTEQVSLTGPLQAPPIARTAASQRVQHRDRFLRSLSSELLVGPFEPGSRILRPMDAMVVSDPEPAAP
jgi:hypothetical protein